MEKPLRISIVTVVYNGEAYLEECINSVLQQDYPNLEYIVIDGGSTDGSVNIIKKFSDRITYWVSEKDSGMYDALNKGFKKSTGEIMGWLNSDDLLMPKSLFLINDLFQSYRDAEWIQGLPLMISPTGFVWGHFQPEGNKYDYYLKRYGTSGVSFIQQETTFWRRTLWERAGNSLNSSYKLAGDFELWLRFFEQGQLYNAKGLFGGFRNRKGQLSEDLSGYKAECSRAVDESMKRLSPATLREINLYKRLRKLEAVPIISRLSRRLFSNFYKEQIESKYLRWNLPK